MNTKIVFFKYRKRGFYGWLVRFLTGLPYYHVGILREDTQRYYEMGSGWHRHSWAERLAVCEKTSSDPVLIDAPVEVAHEHLDADISLDVLDPNSTYGLLDYASFLLRKFGIKVKDLPGVICSEKVWDLLLKSEWGESHGTSTPSPADLFRAVTNRSK